MKLTEGKVVVAAVKMPEQDTDKRWIIRVHETEGQRTTATLQLFQAVSEAYYVDMNERKVTNDGSIQASGKTVTFEVPAYSVASICLEFE